MTSQPDTAYLTPLIESVAAASPGGSPEDKRIIAQAAIAALQPRDVVEAMLVARMVVAHHAAMDAYQRAMQPGVTDAQAVRLRNNAVAEGRAFDTALRTLEKLRTAPASVTQTQEPAAAVAPAPPTPPAQVPQPHTSAPPVAARPHDSVARPLEPSGPLFCKAAPARPLTPAMAGALR